MNFNNVVRATKYQGIGCAANKELENHDSDEIVVKFNLNLDRILLFFILKTRNANKKEAVRAVILIC